jgi:hypothetical protein
MFKARRRVLHPDTILQSHRHFPLFSRLYHRQEGVILCILLAMLIDTKSSRIMQLNQLSNQLAIQATEAFLEGRQFRNKLLSRRWYRADVRLTLRLIPEISNRSYTWGKGQEVLG